MAGRIPRVFISDLLARTDIVDLIDARVKLKKQVFWRKFVVVSSMKNRLPNVSALKLLQ